MVLTVESPASVRKVNFRVLSMRDGLSNDSVRALYQDHRGFIWIGTLYGLNRYDGYRFSYYFQDPYQESLEGNNIFALTSDSRHRLWIGTWGNGLNCFNPTGESFRSFKSRTLELNTLSDNRVVCLLPDSRGNLWVGTDNGLNCFDIGQGSVRRFFPNIRDPGSISYQKINALAEDPEGGIWVGTWNGLNRFDRKTGRFRVFLHDPADPDSISDNCINCLVTDREGMVWAGTRRGLNRIDYQRNRVTRFRHDPGNPDTISHDFVTALAQDRQGRIWAGTRGLGINRFDSRRSIFIRYLDPSLNPAHRPPVWAIMEDNAGNLWFGTRGMGVFQLIEGGLRTEHYTLQRLDSSLGDVGRVYTFFEDRQGGIWIGAEKNTLIRWEPASGRVTRTGLDLSGRGIDHLTLIFQGHAGELWLGTWGGGLIRHSPETGEMGVFTHQAYDAHTIGSDVILALCEDRRGQIWVGTNGGGLSRYDRKTGRFKTFFANPGSPQSLGGDTVTSLLEDRRGNIWIGTWGKGLDRFDHHEESFEHFRHDKHDTTTISSNEITCLFQDSRDRLWVGTNGGGLNRYMPQARSFRHYYFRDRPLYNTVYAIEEDNRGYLWFSSDVGVCRLTPAQETFKYFNYKNGLNSSPYHRGSMYKTRSGDFLVGGVNGFDYLVPDEIGESSMVPPLVVTGFQLIGPRQSLVKEFYTEKEITMDYKDSLYLQFAVVDYSNPVNNRYAYRLEGLHADWIDLGNKNSISLTHPPPGRYLLRIRGCNSDGVWNSEGLSFVTRVAPPFWKTWWFVTALATLALGLLFILFTRKVKSIELAMRKQQKVDAFLRGQDISAREIEIINLLLKGRNRREIGDLLFISNHTVKNHVYHIYQKLGVKNTGELKYLIRAKEKLD